MGLKEYQKKRKFDKTPEPKGKPAAGKDLLRFMVHKHDATRLHYDLRLELDGTLKSWAVPKGPSLNPKDKRLAMMVEDHPLDYRIFEGVIPKGNYGAGSVMIWDQGTYKPYEGMDISDLRQGLKQGDFKFELHGEKLKGKFALVKMKQSKEDNAWLLIKKDDESATDQDITLKDRSVTSGRSMEEIAAGDPSRIDLSEAPKKPLPTRVKPMLAVLTDKPFANPDWVFEVKWDGYRTIAEVTKKGIKLYSRNQQSFDELFKPIARVLEELGHEAVLDGEVVVVDSQGRSRFQLLQNYAKTGEGELIYYVFDVLWLDGHDLTNLPLLRRKQILAQVLPKATSLRLSEHIEGEGEQFFAAAKQQDLEGTIAKESSSPYLTGKRSRYWLKIKTHRRQEAVIAGFTAPRGGRQLFGALILGVYQDGELVYIGHTGTGFSEQTLADLYERLKPLEQKNPPFAKAPKTNAPVTWVKPKLVCEVSFSEWTADGQMRHPVFVGLRLDKSAQSVVKEEEMLVEAEKSSNQEISVGSRRVKVTNLPKVYWPKEGYTKGNVIDYYRQVAPVILPYLKDRPENLNRHPNGIKGESFYQKDINYQPPAWVKTAPIYSESNQKEINYLICQDEATLVYMANLGCIEINPWNSRLKTLEKPDYLIVDLDPEAIGFNKVVEAALVVKEILDGAEVPSYPKTSGATGMHIYVPLGAKYDYDQAKQFTQIVVTLAQQKLPKATSLERSPAKRQRRVYLDYLQNRKGQTLAAAYSLRPRLGAPVATPLKWEEVKPGLDPLAFNIKTIFKRLDKMGDLWKPVIGKGIDLKAALKRLESASLRGQSS